MSIPSHPLATCLPDFRNLGIWLRVLLAANALMLCAALAASPSPGYFPAAVAERAALIEPALLITLALLYGLSPLLQRLPCRPAAACVVLLSALVMAGVDALLAAGFGTPTRAQAPFAAALSAGLILYWLHLRREAQAPSLAEARLFALTARIRPHFFFNSLNAVLGILREDPRRAEGALEALAELFRALMRDHRNLVPFSEEIALARKYLDIERLRLGDRLQVQWDIDTCPPDALSPPLLLQPLLENAVYHGIEPAARPGVIHVRIEGAAGRVAVEIDNPCPATSAPREGNHMALDNLRERLMLFYDLEARLDTGTAGGRYRVRVELPMRRVS